MNMGREIVWFCASVALLIAGLWLTYDGLHSYRPWLAKVVLGLFLLINSSSIAMSHLKKHEKEAV